jgi:exodeoxyribonuclease VII small subunit
MQLSAEEIQSLTYEKAFAELEEIVYGLETNEKTLEEAIALFERGQALAKYCAGLLDQAELKVQTLGAQTAFDEPDEEQEYE